MSVAIQFKNGRAVSTHELDCIAQALGFSNRGHLSYVLEEADDRRREAREWVAFEVMVELEKQKALAA